MWRQIWTSIIWIWDHKANSTCKCWGERTPSSLWRSRRCKVSWSSLKVWKNRRAVSWPKSKMSKVYRSLVWNPTRTHVLHFSNSSFNCNETIDYKMPAQTLQGMLILYLLEGSPWPPNPWSSEQTQDTRCVTARSVHNEHKGKAYHQCKKLILIMMADQNTFALLFVLAWMLEVVLIRHWIQTEVVHIQQKNVLNGCPYTVPMWDRLLRCCNCSKKTLCSAEQNVVLWSKGLYNMMTSHYVFCAIL